MERGPMNPFVRARGLSTHDAWTQGVKCSHPEADAADSTSVRSRTVKSRSGLNPCAGDQVVYCTPPARQGKSPRKEHQGGSLIPLIGRGGIFSHPG